MIEVENRPLEDIIPTGDRWKSVDGQGCCRKAEEVLRQWGFAQQKTNQVPAHLQDTEVHSQAVGQKSRRIVVAKFGSFMAN